MCAEERHHMPAPSRRALITAALAAPVLGVPVAAGAAPEDWRAAMRLATLPPPAGAPDGEWTAWEDRRSIVFDAVEALPPTPANLERKAYVIALIHDGEPTDFIEQNHATDARLARQIIAALAEGV